MGFENPFKRKGPIRSAALAAGAVAAMAGGAEIGSVVGQRVNELKSEKITGVSASVENGKTGLLFRKDGAVIVQQPEMRKPIAEPKPLLPGEEGVNGVRVTSGISDPDFNPTHNVVQLEDGGYSEIEQTPDGTYLRRYASDGKTVVSEGRTEP